MLTSGSELCNLKNKSVSSVSLSFWRLGIILRPNPKASHQKFIQSMLYTDPQLTCQRITHCVVNKRDKKKRKKLATVKHYSCMIDDLAREAVRRKTNRMAGHGKGHKDML